jgi:hypothetical protein
MGWYVYLNLDLPKYIYIVEFWHRFFWTHAISCARLCYSLCYLSVVTKLLENVLTPTSLNGCAIKMYFKEFLIEVYDVVCVGTFFYTLLKLEKVWLRIIAGWTLIFLNPYSRSSYKQMREKNRRLQNEVLERSKTLWGHSTFILLIPFFGEKVLIT